MGLISGPIGYPFSRKGSNCDRQCFYELAIGATSRQNVFMRNDGPTDRRPRLIRGFGWTAILLSVLTTLPGSDIASASSDNHRRLLHLQFDWRFHPGEVPGAEAPGYDDEAWSTIALPHDWAIAGPRTHDAATGMPGGFAPSGIAWYRRAIDVPADWKGQTAWIVFEGVYMNAQIWLNGRLLGVQHYGYSQFRFEITRELKPGATNVLAVRVDTTAQPNSRWYSGSGIYRPVRIEAADAVHLAPDGVSVATTSVAAERASLRVRTTVTNTTNRKQTVTVETRVLRGLLGNPLMVEEPLVLATTTITIDARASALVPQDITISSPTLWSPSSPTLYRLVSRASVGEKFLDASATTFGIRTIAVSPERGFELNGRPLQLNGANVHHDHGPLGAASYPAAEYRRARLLKDAGFNFVRTSHNPPAPAFLDACDELGLLVMDEAFDCWVQGKLPQDYSVWFKDWWQRDLDAMVRRDRNHPSVVMWSIGNEIQEVGRPEGIALAKQLAKRVRELDPTRLVTCGWTVPWILPSEWNELDPSFAALDLAGINYQHKRAEEDHARVPSRVMLATESYQADTFACWATVQDHPYFIGDIVWTGWDYLGESGIGRVYPPGEKVFQHWETDHWPWYGAYCGDIDITGWRKPISHYRNIVWDRGEKLYVAVQEPPPMPGPWQPTMWGVPPALDSWTWPGQEGKPLTVEVYSRHDSVRLFLNDQLIGEKPTTRAEEFKAVFEVPYAPGTLRAVGVSGGSDTESFTLETSGPAVGVRLRPDWGDKSLEVRIPTFAIAEIIDAHGRVVPTANAVIEFKTGPEDRVIAVATGDLTSPEPYVAMSRRAWHGRALVVVQPGDLSRNGRAPLRITATVPELGDATHTLEAPPGVY